MGKCFVEVGVGTSDYAPERSWDRRTVRYEALHHNEISVDDAVKSLPAAAISMEDFDSHSPDPDHDLALDPDLDHDPSTAVFTPPPPLSNR